MVMYMVELTFKNIARPTRHKQPPEVATSLLPRSRVRLNVVLCFTV
jgi:hypothetical protein